MARSHMVLLKVYKKSDKKTKQSSKQIVPICFDNKELQFIPLISTLHENDIKNWLSESLPEGEISSAVYILIQSHHK